MSKAQELADQLEALDKGMLTSMWAREGDKAVVAELRRLDRVNAVQRQALERIRDWPAKDGSLADGPKQIAAEAIALSSSGGTES